MIPFFALTTKTQQQELTCSKPSEGVYVSLTLAGRNIAVLPVDAVLMLCHIAPGAHVSIWISVGNKDTLMILLCLMPQNCFLSLIIAAVHFNVLSHQEAK